MTIAAERDLVVRTDPADTFDPIAVYAAGVEAGLESALWLRASDDLALVGLGRAWSVEAHGDGRFATADAAWRALIRRFGPDDPAWPSGVGPVLLGGIFAKAPGPQTGRRGQRGPEKPLGRDARRDQARDAAGCLS